MICFLFPRSSGFFYVFRGEKSVHAHERGSIVGGSWEEQLLRRWVNLCEQKWISLSERHWPAGWPPPGSPRQFGARRLDDCPESQPRHEVFGRAELAQSGPDFTPEHLGGLQSASAWRSPKPPPNPSLMRICACCTGEVVEALLQTRERKPQSARSSATVLERALITPSHFFCRATRPPAEAARPHRTASPASRRNLGPSS
ncbi:MAG: hypothetical protein RL077_5994 [Verrucomicrobiota bacterium]